MPTSREQLLEQLRKLRRLADDVAGTPEGRAATRKVRELMKRYGISAAEVAPRAAKPLKNQAPQPRPPATRPPTGPASTPATITLRVGNLRIRLKL